MRRKLFVLLLCITDVAREQILDRQDRRSLLRQKKGH
jgi:hypothetical protein